MLFGVGVLQTAACKIHDTFIINAIHQQPPSTAFVNFDGFCSSILKPKCMEI